MTKKNFYLNIFFDKNVHIILNGKEIEKLSYDNFVSLFFKEYSLNIDNIIYYLHLENKITAIGLFFTNNGINNFVNFKIKNVLFPKIKKIHIFYTNIIFIYTNNIKNYPDIIKKIKFIFNNDEKFEYEKFSFIFNSNNLYIDDIFNIENIKQFIYNAKIKNLTVMGSRNFRLNGLKNNILEKLKLINILLITGTLNLKKLKILSINNIKKINHNLLSENFEKLETFIFKNVEEFNDKILDKIFIIKPKNISINNGFSVFVTNYFFNDIKHVKIPFYISNIDTLHLQSITNKPKSLTLQNIKNINIYSSIIENYIVSNSKKTLVNLTELGKKEIKHLLLDFTDIENLIINFYFFEILENIKIKLNNIKNMQIVFNFNDANNSSFLKNFKIFISIIDKIHENIINNGVDAVSFNIDNNISFITYYFKKSNTVLDKNNININTNYLYKINKYFNIYFNNLTNNNLSSSDININKKIENEIIFNIFNIINNLNNTTTGDIYSFFPEFLNKDKIKNILSKTKTRINNI